MERYIAVTIWLPPEIERQIKSASDLSHDILWGAVDEGRDILGRGIKNALQCFLAVERIVRRKNDVRLLQNHVVLDRSP